MTRHRHQFGTWMGLPVLPLIVAALAVCLGIWLLDGIGVLEIGNVPAD